VAAYNEERFVADALESALGQDYPPTASTWSSSTTARPTRRP
jgi:cellulose synthase/poly-beta-1,6-N-acetylglucosamine synthase-like glycosyltransferase